MKQESQLDQEKYVFLGKFTTVKRTSDKGCGKKKKKELGLSILGLVTKASWE